MGVKKMRAVISLLVGCAGLLLPATGSAEEAAIAKLDDRSLEWQLARGGRIYDNWFAAQLAEPPLTYHPMLPAGVDIEPASSWRCVTCHGWDYRGGEMGGKAEEFNAPLPARRAGTDADAIARLLRAAPHSYDPSILSEGALGLVARFVVEGQHDIASYADRQTGKAKGDPLEGRPVYQGVCISCHDSDGRAYIEGEPGDQSSLGWLARNRPNQVLHKIRNGQPGTDMVQLRFLKDTQITNLLAYLQTLPDP